MGFFSSKKTTYDPMSAYTPQQRQAVEALMSLASTGSGGGINLGEAYTGELGSYDTSGQQISYDQLMELFSGGALGTAEDLYTRMATNKFNPDDPSSGYAAYSRALAKAGKESSDVIDREAARTGSRFGTAISGAKADLSADLANQRGMFLADLYNQGENRALQGASGLQNVTSMRGNLSTTASQQAAMINAIKDAQAKDSLNEYKRQREEELSRIGLMQDQWATPMGKITKKGPSTFMSMLGEVSPLVGSYNTHKYGYTANQSSISDALDAFLSLYSGGMSGSSAESGSSSNSRLLDLYDSGGFNPRSFGGY